MAMPTIGLIGELWSIAYAMPSQMPGKEEVVELVQLWSDLIAWVSYDYGGMNVTENS